MDKGGNSENPRIIVLEPTCVGAVNTLKVYLVQSNVVYLWRRFQIVELTEVEIQQSDYSFIKLFDKIREGDPR